MTHDELLAKINALDEHWKSTYPQLTAWKVLRAVVELHKPSDGQCYECHYEGRNYPCETIQAIEEQLS